MSESTRVARLILTAPMGVLNASTVFAVVERPFLAFLSPPTPFSRGTRPLSSKSSNHSSMETQAGLYLFHKGLVKDLALKSLFNAEIMQVES